MKDELTEKIIGCALEVHKVLGPGLLESLYEEALCQEFDIQKLHYSRQKEIHVHYKGRKLGILKLDLLVAEQVIVEIKSLTQLPEVALAQILSYLKATGLKRGLILNFGHARLVEGIKRVSL